MDATHYTFVAEDDPDLKIEFPRVTHIIGSTLAAPGLLRWYFDQTVDAVSGLLPWAGDQASTLEDPDVLREWLQRNRMRPMDVAEDASLRGRAVHAYFQARLLGDDPRQADVAAELAVEPAHLDKSVEKWYSGVEGWLAANPTIRPVFTERRVWSLRYGYAGTLDLLYARGDYHRTLLDLKSRKAGAASYASDDVQLTAYDLAVEESLGIRASRKTVLVVRGDGSFDEYPSAVSRQVWLDCLSLYKGLVEK